MVAEEAIIRFYFVVNIGYGLFCLEGNRCFFLFDGRLPSFFRCDDLSLSVALLLTAAVSVGGGRFRLGGVPRVIGWETLWLVFVRWSFLIVGRYWDVVARVGAVVVVVVEGYFGGGGSKRTAWTGLYAMSVSSQ